MKQTRRLNYRVRVSVIIMLFAMLPTLALGLPLLRYVNAERREQALSGARGTLAACGRLLQSQAVSMKAKAQYLCANQGVISFISTLSRQDMVEKLTFIDVLREQVNALVSDNAALSVRVYALEGAQTIGEFCLSAAALEESLAGEAALEAIAGAAGLRGVWRVGALGDELGRARAGEYLCFYRRTAIHGAAGFVVEVALPLSWVRARFDGLTDGAEYMALMMNGTELPISGLDALPGDAARCERLTTATEEIGGELALFVPRAQLDAASVSPFWALLFLAFAALCAEGASWLLTRRFTRLIRDAAAGMRGLLPEPHQSGNDLERLDGYVHWLIDTVRERATRAEADRVRLQTLQMELLQERFNPHFLYNSLGALHFIVREREAREIIESLIAFYRLSLNKGSMWISLENELLLMARYVRLQCLTCGYDVRLVTDVPPEAANRPVLKQMLQPLVENALLHGIGNQAAGEIRISARQDGERLELTVADNGEGMSPETLCALREGGGSGYGLANLRARLALCYEGRAGLEFEAAPGGGTVVRLRLEDSPASRRVEPPN